ncbi:Biotin lipoyl and E3 binding and 2-oxoacid dh dom ain containing protein [Trichuris trichiura]|uniref:Acetyltransferase component of pyruvate dehydrogenase complex n=1 Tax=Trichuris trichiura TaxID=36087 RepID=A0A077Z0S4_TRITR|nr:Biotin lipoyl and E3 binding and 2-oxoacid dh dom ain containing protein [Trichuris trichiura]
MEKGNVVSWKKKEGDQIAEGDLMCEIETDKATMGFEASDEGYLAKIVVPEGAKDVPVGKLLCIVVESADDVAAFASVSAADLGADEEAPKSAAPPPPPPPSAAPPPTPTPVSAPSPPVPMPPPAAMPQPMPVGGRVFASPLAKTLAAQKQLDLTSVKGSGPSGRIVAADLAGVTAPVAAPVSAMAAGGSYADLEISNVRQVIARRLLESKVNIPHYYLNIDVEIDEIVKLRQKLNEELKEENRKLSLNDIIIKASALACKAVPEVNSSWLGSVIRRYDYVDVSVAVSTQSGLITPIIFNADSKGLLEISEEMIALGARAKDGKLQPHEFQGGTFSVSNLGMFGVDRFSAIINPPQAAILAVGTSQKIVAFDKDKRCVEKTLMSVTLSCDHRVIDGAVGARWLQHFKKLMEKPATMLL